MKKNDWKYLLDSLLFVNICSLAAIGLLLAFVIPSGKESYSDKYFLGLHRHDWGDLHRRISEPHTGPSPVAAYSKKELFGLPFGERNFRNFLLFAISWGFAVNFASPFFTLYFLRYLGLSYGFVAVLGTISACADLVGMQVWGRISDKVRNKAIIQFAGWVAVFLPLAWVTVSPGNYVMPVILHVVGGGFWAGINLCTNNLLLRISPRENRPFFLSIYNIVAGVGAALGPVMGGLAGKYLANLHLEFAGVKLVPLQVIFLTSTTFRFLSLQLFKYVHEPEEATVGQLVRVLSNVRGLNVATGFNYLLHPFIEIMGKEEQS